MAWWVMPVKVRFSVPGACYLPLWAGAQDRKEKKKVKRCDSGPGLAQACAAQLRPSMCSRGLAWVNSGPTCTFLHSEFNHQHLLCCTRTCCTRIFPQIRKPPAPVPACMCLRLRSRL